MADPIVKFLHVKTRLKNPQAVVIFDNSELSLSVPQTKLAAWVEKKESGR